MAVTALALLFMMLSSGWGAAAARTLHQSPQSARAAGANTRTLITLYNHPAGAASARAAMATGFLRDGGDAIRIERAHRMKRSDMDILTFEDEATMERAKARLERMRSVKAVAYDLPQVQLTTFNADTLTYATNARAVYDSMGVPHAWDVTMGDPEVVIAIIDTGIDPTHPAFAGRLWVNPGEVAGDGVDNDGNGYVDDVHGASVSSAAFCCRFHQAEQWEDCLRVSRPIGGNITATHWHGTAVAGAAGAAGVVNGTAGVAPGARLMIINPTCEYDGSKWTSQIFLALEYALDNGAHVVVMSIGHVYPRDFYPGSAAPPHYTTSNTAYVAAIAPLAAAGVLIVAAAGNSAIDLDNLIRWNYTYNPCGMSRVYSTVLCVGATSGPYNASGLATGWGFSNSGPGTVNVAAPGDNVTLPVLGNAYATGLMGTSFSAPFVAGGAALVLSVLGAHSRDFRQAAAVRAILQNTTRRNSAVSQGAADLRTMTGGVVRVDLAVHEALRLVGAPPNASPVMPLDYSVNDVNDVIGFTMELDGASYPRMPFEVRRVGLVHVRAAASAAVAVVTPTMDILLHPVATSFFAQKPGWYLLSMAPVVGGNATTVPAILQLPGTFSSLAAASVSVELAQPPTCAADVFFPTLMPPDALVWNEELMWISITVRLNGINGSESVIELRDIVLADAVTGATIPGVVFPDARITTSSMLATTTMSSARQVDMNNGTDTRWEVIASPLNSTEVFATGVMVSCDTAPVFCSEYYAYFMVHATLVQRSGGLQVTNTMAAMNLVPAGAANNTFMVQSFDGRRVGRNPSWGLQDRSFVLRSPTLASCPRPLTALQRPFGADQVAMPSMLRTGVSGVLVDIGVLVQAVGLARVWADASNATTSPWPTRLPVPVYFDSWNDDGSLLRQRVEVVPGGVAETIHVNSTGWVRAWAPEGAPAVRLSMPTNATNATTNATSAVVVAELQRCLSVFHWRLPKLTPPNATQLPTGGRYWLAVSVRAPGMLGGIESRSNVIVRVPSPNTPMQRLSGVPYGAISASTSAPAAVVQRFSSGRYETRTPAVSATPMTAFLTGAVLDPSVAADASVLAALSTGTAEWVGTLVLRGGDLRAEAVRVSVWTEGVHTNGTLTWGTTPVTGVMALTPTGADSGRPATWGALLLDEWVQVGMQPGYSEVVAC